MLSENSLRARALSAALEPVIGQAHFAPEVHDAMEAFGFAPSSGIMTDEWNLNYYGPTLLPDYSAYISSRGATLGTPRGEVVAAAFGVFQPELIIALVNQGQKLASGEQLRAARREGATAQLIRILGRSPERVGEAVELLRLGARDLTVGGRPLFAGTLAADIPDEPLGAVWQLGDRLREYRGDSFTVAWAAAGFDGCSIQLLTEIIAGYPRRIYTSGRGWNEEQMDAAEAALTARGYVENGTATEAGRAAREAVELTTDAQCAPIIDALGDRSVDLIAILRDWSGKIIVANGHAPGTPQTQVMDVQVQHWMRDHALEAFVAGP